MMARGVLTRTVPLPQPNGEARRFYRLRLTLR